MSECAGIKDCFFKAVEYMADEVVGSFNKKQVEAPELPSLGSSEFLWQETPIAKCIDTCDEFHRNSVDKFRECMDSCLGKNKTGLMETGQVVIIGVGGAHVFSLSIEDMSGVLDMSGSDRMDSDPVLRLLSGRMTIDPFTGQPVPNMQDDHSRFEMLLRASGVRMNMEDPALVPLD